MAVRERRTLVLAGAGVVVLLVLLAAAWALSGRGATSSAGGGASSPSMSEPPPSSVSPSAGQQTQSPSAEPAPADDGEILGAGTVLALAQSSASAAGLGGAELADAELLGSVPSAWWLTGGSPENVEQQVRTIVDGAAAAGQVPVLVAYDLPFRDCAQYSAGGAADRAAYEAWVDGVAAGIGTGAAVVLVEPDGLGIIPWYTSVTGEQEWCRPDGADPATAAGDRFAMVNHAVDVLTALPRTAVYLDGTHSGWLGVGDAADRLRRAGVDRADGFFLNVSNYQATENLVRYGAWVSFCLDLVARGDVDPASCPSQYSPASPDDLATWGATDDAYARLYQDAGRVPDPAELAHAVIDTSRNGQGPWTPPAGAYADPEAWCNPPGRGLGLRPTTGTGEPLVDAYLWVKLPGESDGRCLRGTAGPTDPVRGTVAPPAGAWFPAQARELIELAVPPLEG